MFTLVLNNQSIVSSDPGYAGFFNKRGSLNLAGSRFAHKLAESEYEVGRHNTFRWKLDRLMTEPGEDLPMLAVVRVTDLLAAIRSLADERMPF
jgi:hypothetical protein